MLSSNSIQRGLINGAIVSVADLGLKKEDSVEALKNGGIMVAGSLLSEAFVNQFVSPITPAGFSLVISDGLTFAGLESLRKSERNMSDFWMNLIEGSVASFTSNYFFFASIFGLNSLSNMAGSIYASNAANIGANTSVAVPTVAGQSVNPAVAIPIPSSYASL